MACSALSLARIGPYLALTLLLMPFQALAIAFGSPLATRIPLVYHDLVLRILGIRIDRRGHLCEDRPTLFVANHASYMDIEILGAVLPASFVAKIEVKAWPLFGILARLQRTVFVDRQVRTARNQRDSLTTRLAAGENLILFPEGTSNDATFLQPFKSALFGAAELWVADRPVTVQPVSLAYVRLDGVPVTRRLRPLYAWYGDMTLARHMWTLIGLGRTEVVVQFHAPVTIERFGSRKKLAEYCAAVIAEGVAAANAGRLPQASPAEQRIEAAPGMTKLPDPALGQSA
jgi:1-acyl-sn-glycerol-3-phosphate acyltransferase